MTRTLKIIIFLLLATTLTSCHKTKNIVLSKHHNGKPKEIIEYKLPLTKDSIGIKKIFFQSGKLQSFGQTQKGKRYGEWISYFENGKLEWKAYYDNEVENGELTCYYQNDTWRKTIMKNGCKNGKTTEFNYDSTSHNYFYINGQYINCKEEGQWTKTDTSGVLLNEFVYINGKLASFSEHYKNGKIRFKADINKDGKYINIEAFDENGIKTKYEAE